MKCVYYLLPMRCFTSLCCQVTKLNMLNYCLYPTSVMVTNVNIENNTGQVFVPVVNVFSDLREVPRWQTNEEIRCVML